MLPIAVLTIPCGYLAMPYGIFEPAERGEGVVGAKRLGQSRWNLECPKALVAQVVLDERNVSLEEGVSFVEPTPGEVRLARKVAASTSIERSPNFRAILSASCPNRRASA